MVEGFFKRILKPSSNEIKKVTFKENLVFEAAYLVTERFNHQI